MTVTTADMSSNIGPGSRPKRKLAPVGYKEPNLSGDGQISVISDGEIVKVPPSKASFVLSDLGRYEMKVLITKQKMKSTHASRKRTKASKSEIFPFLSMPGELRNQIYELALVNPDGHYLVATYRKGMRTVRAANHGAYSNITSRYFLPKHRDATTAHGLFAVNRQTNEEARTLVYSKPFVFENDTALHTFFVAIGAKNRALLTNISLETWCGRGSFWNMPFQAFSMLLFPSFSMLSMGCDNISRFHFKPTLHEIMHPEHLAEAFYTKAHPWLRALVRSKGSTDAAVAVIEFNADENEQGRCSVNHRIDVRQAMDKFKAALKRRLC